MERIEVHPTQMHDVAESLDGVAAHIDGHTRDIAIAAATLREQWEGDAQQAFDDRASATIRSFDERAKGLRTVARSIDDSAQDYADLDRAAARGLGGQQ